MCGRKYFRLPVGEPTGNISHFIKPGWMSQRQWWLLQYVVNSRRDWGCFRMRCLLYSLWTTSSLLWMILHCGKKFNEFLLLLHWILLRNHDKLTWFAMPMQNRNSYYIYIYISEFLFCMKKKGKQFLHLGCNKWSQEPWKGRIITTNAYIIYMLYCQSVWQHIFIIS